MKLKFILLAAAMGLGPVLIGEALHQAFHHEPAPPPRAMPEGVRLALLDRVDHLQLEADALELRAVRLASMPLLAQAPAEASVDAPDIIGWLTDKLGPTAAKWLALLGVVGLFASWLISSINGFEAILIKQGWWSGKRKGVYLWIYSALQFLAQNLSRFFPSRVGQNTTAAPAAKAGG